MAIELTIKQGDQAAASKDFLTAISKFTDALKENPNAFSALVKRAQVYTKLSDYEAAKADISKAFTIAEQRGKMSDKATCYFRLGLVNYAQKDYSTALINLNRAKELKSSEPALDIWIEKAKRDCKKHASAHSEEQAKDKAPGETENSVSSPQTQSVSAATDSKSTSIDAINKQAPLRVKIRNEWYQSKTSVTITIFAKDVARDSIQFDLTKRTLSVCFPTTENSEYSYSLDRLYSEVDPEKSFYNVTSKKIEIVLHKVHDGKWATLEGEGADLTSAQPSEPSSQPGLAYPSSSRKKTNWSSFDVKDDEDESGDFFAKLYKDVDEDTRRAMMKSYVESNGTVLTTNWEEAKDKTFDTSPPDGMEARKWA